jgi:hypothetical protein
MNSQENVGRKVKGFEFKGKPTFVNPMNKHIGKIGIITHNMDDCYSVRFASGEAYNYPYPEILDHLVDKEPEIELSLEELVNNVKVLISKI